MISALNSYRMFHLRISSNSMSISAERFRLTEIGLVMCLGAAVGADVTWIVKKLLDLRVTIFALQLAGMQVTMFFRFLATAFCHHYAPRLPPLCL